jgi:Zn-finger in ubiquitin-hydrolases and other protein
MTSCMHLDHVRITQLPESVDGCEECLVTGDPLATSAHLSECGKVGCCDDSPNRHASAHAHSSSHPIIRSLEPGDEWSWCFVDDFAMLIPDVHGETHIPPSPLADRDEPGLGSRGRLLSCPSPELAIIGHDARG